MGQKVEREPFVCAVVVSAFGVAAAEAVFLADPLPCVSVKVWGPLQWFLLHDTL